MIIVMDDSSLSAQGKREMLLNAQSRLCGCCGTPDPAEADHDHKTGLLRGILCSRCNKTAARWESAFCNNLTPFPAMEHYLADPPGHAFAFMWDLPDWWSQSDTARIRQLKITAYEYVRAGWTDHDPEAEAKQAVVDLGQINLPKLANA